VENRCKSAEKANAEHLLFISNFSKCYALDKAISISGSNNAEGWGATNAGGQPWWSLDSAAILQLFSKKFAFLGIFLVYISTYKRAFKWLNKVC